MRLLLSKRHTTTHAHTYTYILTHTHIHTHTQKNPHTQTHTLSLSHTLTNTHTHLHGSQTGTLQFQLAEDRRRLHQVEALAVVLPQARFLTEIEGIATGMETGIRGRWRRAWRPAAMDDVSGHATGMHGVDTTGISGHTV